MRFQLSYGFGTEGKNGGVVEKGFLKIFTEKLQNNHVQIKNLSHMEFSMM